VGEVPFLPQLEQISHYSIIGLSLLALLTLLTVSLSHWFSTALVSTIIRLQETTRTFPERMGQAGTIPWPQSKITELEELSRNFQEMGQALTDSFRQLKNLNESLEQRVQERTRELEEREGFIRDVLDSLTAHVAVLDHRGEILVVNEAWRRFARENGGAEEALSVGLNYFSVCEKALQSGADGEISRLLAGLQAVMKGAQKEFSLEYACHSPSEQRWFTLQCSRLTGLQKGVVVAHENSTARIRAELLLRESEEKYRKLFENDLNAICIYDSQTLRFIDVNEAHVRLYGHTRQELLEQCTLQDLSAEPKATAEAIRRARAGETIFVPLRYHQKKDGTVFPVEIVVGPYIIKDRPVIFAIARDITERQRSEEAIKHYTIQLRESNQALKDFVFIASHDLQEPLRKVRTFGNMLAQRWGASLEDQGRDYLERMIAAAAHMQSLLTALLEYSRLSTRAAPYESVDLNAVLEEVLSDLELTIQKSGGKVTTGRLPVIQADPVQIRQLLQNLIGNGLKFHRLGQPPEVKVSCQTVENGWIRIEVEDNGIGFQEEYLDRIFDPFQRLHGKTSPYKGTGMGLTICKKIVDRHGGRITARSLPGRGSTFIVELPPRDKND
jgi:two-component system, LuxR family, sensor kinase FixL